MAFEDMFGSAKREQAQASPAPRYVPPEAVSDEDREISALLQESLPKIMVIGAGGSGCNTLNRIQEIGITGARLVAMNTDAQHLLKIKADKKLVLGKKKTKGLGAGSNPEVGEAAAQESFEEIKAIVAGSDLVFVTCGMGGGTGTGSAHMIAKAAKDTGALCIGVVTTPFYSEGSKRRQNAFVGIEKLKREADTTIAIPNDRLLEIVPDLPLNAAFKAADSVLANAVKGITELVTKPGLVNLDFADIRTILEKAGMAMIGLGEVEGSDKPDRVTEAAEKALSSPFLDLDVGTANKALINITGGSDLTLGEAESAMNAISQRIAKDAHIIWGATVDDSLKNRGVRVLAVLSGISEKAEKKGGSAADAPEGDIDLDFI
ncbi:MAG: cell division protein FtsZ [Candidatus Micrarchaeia archaeon]|jgi:cell division protein FtsZ